MTNHPNHAAATEDVQRYLRQLSYGEPTIPPPPIDGIFDTRTTDALQRFQLLKGLTQPALPTRGRGSFCTPTTEQPLPPTHRRALFWSSLQIPSAIR